MSPLRGSSTDSLPTWHARREPPIGLAHSVLAVKYFVDASDAGSDAPPGPASASSATASERRVRIARP
jgi:hypothetical protein